MIKTEAGEKMKQENPVEEKQDINQDGEYEAWEQARQEAIAMAQKFEPEVPEMNCGGLMGDGMGVIIGIEEESGNEIPAGSMPKEVADDIPAMLSEGEYVVPADVVRWHGLKHLEAMRQEAKMGLGLMAQDGRIAEVEVEESEKPEYEIEEDDKPEVEEAEVKVIEAAEGVSVEGTDVTEEIAAPTFYRYESRLNPDTGQYEIVPIDPDTGTVVTDAQFDPTRSTRYGTQTVLERDVYGRSLGGEEIPDCGEGFVYDEELGACVPEEPVVAQAQPEPRQEGPYTGGRGPSYNYTTEELDTALTGLLGEDAMADLNSIKADQKAFAESGVGQLSPAIAAIGNVVNGVREYFARNSLLDEVRKGSYLDVTSEDYGKWRSGMNNALAGSVAISENEARNIASGQGDWRTSQYGSESEAEAVSKFGWGSGFDTEEDTGQLAEIERGFDFSGTRAGLEEQGFDMTTYDEATGSDWSGGDNEGSTDTGSSQDTGTSNTSDEDDESAAAAGAFGGFNKGGMPVKKNTPKKAMIKYSKGSK